MTYLRDVARALADDDPAITKIARRALGQIEAQIQSLRAEGDTIRRIADFVSTQRGVPLSIDLEPDATAIPKVVLRPTRPQATPEDESAGLSDAEKEQINRIIESAIVHAPGITAEALVAVIEGDGVPITSRVARPASVVGTMLYHARRRIHAAPSDRGVIPDRQVTPTRL